MRDKREAGRERMADRKEGKLRALKKNVGEKGNQRLGQACKCGGCLSALTIVQSYEIGIYILKLRRISGFLGGNIASVSMLCTENPQEKEDGNAPRMALAARMRNMGVGWVALARLTEITARTARVTSAATVPMTREIWQLQP